MILDQFSLQGRVAIVTGCNAGLGQAMAVGLAEAGADIVGVYRSETDETRRLVEALDRRFVPVKADLSSIEPVPRIIEEAVAACGAIDILLNNAGIIRRGASLEFSEQDWDAVLDTNLKTLFFLSQAAARQFVKQNSGGKIINVASMLSFQGGIKVPSYTASKSGVMGVTKILANEWAPMGINVNAIAPGYMETRNTAPLRNDPKRNQAILGRIPAGRWGAPEDLNGAAVFLASAASDYVHGYTVAVDGGWLAR
jgi:2-deoxy-D-gluconate 3-dehydrogenase